MRFVNDELFICHTRKVGDKNQTQVVSKKVNCFDDAFKGYFKEFLEFECLDQSNFMKVP